MTGLCLSTHYAHTTDVVLVVIWRSASQRERPSFSLSLSPFPKCIGCKGWMSSGVKHDSLCPTANAITIVHTLSPLFLESISAWSSTGLETSLEKSLTNRVLLWRQSRSPRLSAWNKRTMQLGVSGNKASGPFSLLWLAHLAFFISRLRGRMTIRRRRRHQSVTNSSKEHSCRIFSLLLPTTTNYRRTSLFFFSTPFLPIIPLYTTRNFLAIEQLDRE